MKVISGWFLFAFFVGACIGVFHTDAIRGGTNVRDLPFVGRIADFSVPRSIGFLSEWKNPKEPSERISALRTIGKSIQLDVFLSEWETTRSKLSPEEQSEILKKVMPRIFVCRPEIGISRIVSLIGDVPSHMLPLQDMPNEMEWFETIYAKGGPTAVKTKGELGFANSIFSAYSNLHPSEASNWSFQNWNGDGRDSVFNLLRSGFTAPPPVELIGRLLNEGDPELKQLLPKVEFKNMNTEEAVGKAFDLINGVNDPDVQALLAAKLARANYSLLSFTLDQLNNLPEGQVRDAGTSAFVEFTAKNYPDRALDLLALNTLPKESRGSVSTQLIKQGYIDNNNINLLVDTSVKSLSEGSSFTVALTGNLINEGTNPEIAIQFTNLLPEGEAKLEAQRKLAENLPVRDPVAASIWINSLPIASGLRDIAIQHLVKSISDDHEAANAWAQSISSTELRERAMSSLKK